MHLSLAAPIEYVQGNARARKAAGATVLVSLSARPDYLNLSLITLILATHSEREVASNIPLYMMRSHQYTRRSTFWGVTAVRSLTRLPVFVLAEDLDRFLAPYLIAIAVDGVNVSGRRSLAHAWCCAHL